LKKSFKEEGTLMDRRFLEFWGNSLLHAAKGQKRMEDLTQWITQGLKGFEDMTAMFKKFYGLESLPEKSADYLEAWQNAADSFQGSFKHYLNLMGVVPKDEHLEVVKKYEDLKQRASDQEETINHLRRLLEEKGVDQDEAVRGFQDLVKKQTKQFQELMRGFGQFLEKKTPDS
jgi:hypothetical protein